MTIGATFGICNGTQAQNELLCRDWCADAITVVVGTLHKTVFAGIALPCQQVVHSTHKALLLLLAPILIVDARGVGWRLATTTIRLTKTSIQWLICEIKSAEQVIDCNREIDSSEMPHSPQQFLKIQRLRKHFPSLQRQRNSHSLCRSFECFQALLHKNLCTVVCL